MNAPAHPFENDPTDPSGERARRHAEVLEELAEMGMVMARMLKGQITEQLKRQERVDVPEVSTAFSRVSRSVRLCLALEDRLAEHHATRVMRIRRGLREADGLSDNLAEAPVEGFEPYASEPLRPMSPALRKAVVGKAVADIVRAERDTPERDDERLAGDIFERLDKFDDVDFATRTIGEIAGEICDDLQVMVNWPRWRAADWAAMEIREKNRRSPFFRAEAGAGHSPVRDRGPPSG